MVKPDEVNCKKPHIKCASPREAFGRILALTWRDLPISEGIHPTCVISQDAEVEFGAFVGPFCVVEAGSHVAEDAKIYPFCYVGENCRIAGGAKLYPGVTLYRDVHIGERTIVHSGAVLGADGFGYFWDGTRHRKVPQVGSVRIGDDCEIGALTAIDRATAGDTRIGKGTKLDNLIQIAHNVEIGVDTVIASQSGIAGSSKVGARNLFAGQVGMVDHVSTADDVSLGARTAVTKSVTEPGTYMGMPPHDASLEKRIQIALTKLPELLSRVRKLEQELESLKKANED